MKLNIILSTILLLAAGASAAGLSSTFTEAAKYESGGGSEPLRQIEQAVRESAGNAARRAEVEAGLVQMLAPSSTFEARRFACTQLAVIGTASSFSAISQLLKEPETTGMACLALGSNPSPKVNQILRDALPTASGLARIQLIVTLGQRGDTAAVKALGELAHDRDAATAEAAIGSLGKIANAEALAQLAGLRKNPDQAHAATLASLVVADQAGQRGDRKAAVVILEELLAASQPVPVRRAALEGLFRLDADKGEKRVLSILRGDDSVLKPTAIARVRAFKSKSASQQFAKEMAALTPSEQVQMLQAFASRDDAPARAAITERVSASDAAVRRAAVIALSSAGDAKSVPVLIKALDAAGNVEEEQTIELALASLRGGAEVDQQICALLKNGTASRQPILINVLARRGSHASVPVLLKLAESTEPTVARSAFRALGKLASPSELAALLDKLVNLKTPEARSDAEGAVTKVISKTTDTGKRFTAVSSALGRTTDMETRCMLIGFYPTCGGAQALEAVKSARADKDSRLREAALRALAAWPDASAIDPLLAIVQSAAGNAEREVALRGCVWLLENTGEESPATVAARFEKLTPLAKSASERKLVISGLAKVHDPLALKLIEPLLNDAEVQPEAAQAIITLAPHLAASSREATRSVLQNLIDLPVDEALKKTARELLAQMNKTASGAPVPR